MGGPAAPAGGWQLADDCKPYAADPPKQARFEAFLQSSREGQGWAEAEEGREFAKVAAFFSRPKHSVISERFTSSSMHISMPAGMSKGGGAKAAAPAAPAVPTAPPPEPVRSEAAQAAAAGMFGKLTRKTEPWAPEQLLCKRLNVPVPAVAEPARQEGRGGGGVGKRSWESTMTFNDALLPLPQLDAPTATGTRGARQAPPPPPPPPPQAQHGQARAAADALLANLSGASSSDGTAKGTLSAGAAAPAPSPAAAAASVAMEEDADDGPEERPPLDLFRAIFDSDSEEDAPAPASAAQRSSAPPAIREAEAAPGSSEQGMAHLPNPGAPSLPPREPSPILSQQQQQSEAVGSSSSDESAEEEPREGHSKRKREKKKKKHAASKKRKKEKKEKHKKEKRRKES